MLAKAKQSCATCLNLRKFIISKTSETRWNSFKVKYNMFSLWKMQFPFCGAALIKNRCLDFCNIYFCIQLLQKSSSLNCRTEDTDYPSSAAFAVSLHNLFPLWVYEAKKWGSLHRSTEQNINGPNINELQINCSLGQQKPVDVLYRALY